MAEEMVELGFEGLDRFADRHFDKTYDRLPAIPRTAKQKRKLEQRQREYLQRTHGKAPQDGPYPPRNHPENHPDKGYTSRSTAPKSANGYKSDPEMYAPDSRQDRYGRDDRYYESEQNGYTAPGPGFKVPRGRDGPSDNTRGMQVAPYEQQPQSEYGQQSIYGGAGERPAFQRRGSSWSPPRSQRQGRSKSRRRRSNSRSRSRSNDMKSRLMATVGGALVGGLAGNRATKGKKYDTVATIAGAIIGGVGAKEAACHWDDRKRKKEQQRNGEWDEDSDDSKRRSDRRRDDRYERDDRTDRYDRDDRTDRYDRDDRTDRYDRNDRYDRDDRRRY